MIMYVSSRDSNPKRFPTKFLEMYRSFVLNNEELEVDFRLLIAALSSAKVVSNCEVVDGLFKALVSKLANTRINEFMNAKVHPASGAFSYGTYALYREKALHESCQVLIQHAQCVAKIQFRTQAGSPFQVKSRQRAKRSSFRTWKFCILPLVFAANSSSN